MLKFGKIKPLLDRVVVRKIEPPKKTSGGILLPEAKGGMSRVGVVVSVGEGRHSETGFLVKTTLKVGQNVLLPEYGGAKVPKQDSEDELYIYSENDIIAVLEETNNKL